MNPQMCFYCKKKIASADRNCAVFKAVQRFSQEKLIYVNYNFPIRVCVDCYDIAKKNRKIRLSLYGLAFALPICFFIIRFIVIKPPVDEIFEQIYLSIIGSFLLFGVLGMVFTFLFIIVTLIFKKDTEVKNAIHPFVLKLKEYDWHLAVPHPKYDEMPKDILNGDANEEEVNKKRKEYLIEAQSLYMEYVKSAKNCQIDSFESTLIQIANNLSTELACECISQYSKIEGYENNILLKTQLPQLLQEMNLSIEDVLNDNNYFCTIAVEIDDNEIIISRISNLAVKVSEAESILGNMVNTTVKSFGIITKNRKKYKTIKFLLKYKNGKIQASANMINNHENTKVIMKGKIKDDGLN